MKFIKIQLGVLNIQQARFAFREILVRFIQGFINKGHTQYSDYSQSYYVKHERECNITKDRSKKKVKNHALMAWGTRGRRMKGRGQEEAERATCGNFTVVLWLQLGAVNSCFPCPYQTHFKASCVSRTRLQRGCSVCSVESCLFVDNVFFKKNSVLVFYRIFHLGFLKEFF